MHIDMDMDMDIMELYFMLEHPCANAPLLLVVSFAFAAQIQCSDSGSAQPSQCVPPFCAVFDRCLAGVIGSIS